ncbi:MAG: uracil-DNA glycosylase [Pseudomonadota bacterium]
MQATERKAPAVDGSWLRHIGSEFEQTYMRELSAFLRQRKRAGATVYPPGAEMFNALNACAFERVRVVVLGQDPYHGPGQAHGLSFSVRRGVDIPPSLRNIYDELHSDLGVAPAAHGELQHWADQGVCLLNSVLSVERGRAGAHQGQGWERFTDVVVRTLAEQREHVVFMLWGSYAQKKGQFIDQQRHLVIKSPHPSPLSAYRGFLGSKPFSRCNTYLERTGQAAVDWMLPA